MTINPKDLIEIAESADLNVRSYSGRGMYGKECVGITGSTLQHVLADLVLAEFDFDKEDLAYLIRAARTDNMGMDTIVYWPNLQWPEEE